MQRRLFYCDHHQIPLPQGHKFPMEKYAMLRHMLEADGMYRLDPAPFAARETIELAHDPTYVANFLNGTLDPRVLRRIGFPWSECLVKRTLASVGGTLAGAHDALQCGLGGNLAGGTHHAFRGEGAGFCVFNDIAVTVLALRWEGLAARAAVIDLDVHQGDGTAAIFEDDPDVLTFSMHGANNFPFRKQRSKLDVELADRTGDAEYLKRLEEAMPVVADFRPDLVIYQSGVDALQGDRLGRLSLSPAGLIARDETVFRFTKENGIPVAITLGGGYGDPIARTAEAHANTFRSAAVIYGD
jgi:acetoin utilization deacetylase AcuC-like enzyme